METFDKLTISWVGLKSECGADVANLTTPVCRARAGKQLESQA